VALNDRCLRVPTEEEEVSVLANTDAVATIAVRKVEAAKKFYEGTLGLKPMPAEEPGVVTYKSGKANVLVYESQYAGTNKATAATWAVENLEGVVRDLKAKGVRFEHYDFPGATRQGDVHGTGKTKAAWFKDPDGNILALVSR
jgi:catechol 2,3-dioxygenase-like lactoylglutathione lyase family enzyme